MMDDGIGIYVVEELMRENTKSNLHFVIGESDIDYCLEQIDGATLVIIIDAVVIGKKPGEVTVFSISELSEQQSLNISPHNLHLFNVLSQQREWMKGVIIGIEPFEICFHIGLSQTLEQKFKQIHHNVKCRFDKIMMEI